MRTPSHILLWFVCALVVLGCERTVVVDVPPHESQLVVKGLFTPDSLWKVHVSGSIGFNERSIPTPNATVEIWKDGQMLEALMPGQHGLYRAQRTRPQPGASYELRVEAPGYAPVTAEARLPEPPPLSQTWPQITTSPGVDEYGGNFVEVDITLTDPADRLNYYAVDVFQRIIFYNERQGTTTSEEVPMGFESNDIVLRGVDAFDESEYFTAAYFTDELFDGQKQTITIRVFPPFVFDERSFRDVVELQLRLRTTDEDFFRYHKTVELQRSLGDNPFAEPVRIHSNMSNGFGIFAGYYGYEFNIME